MGLIQRIAAAFRPNAQPATIADGATKEAPIESEKGLGNGTWDFGSGIRYNLGSYSNTPIDRLLNETSGLTPGVDPRAVLGTCQALNYILPVYIAAQTGFLSLLGKPIIVSKDEKFKELVEKRIWPNIRLHGEKVDFLTQTLGIEHVAKSLLSRAFTHGMGFYVLVDDEQAIASSPKQKITGVRVCDPMRWTPQEMAPDRITWQYVREGMIYDIKRDLIAGSVNLPSRRMPEGVWNRPMAYEGMFMAEILLKALKARARKHVRDGSPATITTIGSEYPKDADPDTLKSNQAAMTASLGPILQVFKEAIQTVNETGKSVDLVIPHGGPLDIKSHTYGEGQTWLTNFQDEIREYLRWIAVSTGFPIYRLVPTDGGGLNANNSESQDDAAVQISISEHQPAVGAELKSITNTICLRDGIRIPADYEVQFEGGNFDNPKTVAEIEKLFAETQKIFIEAYAALRIESEVAAAEFAEQMGLEYLEGAKMNPLPKVPPVV